jgi:tetratricopeptide (TPR) repeat protein
VPTPFIVVYEQLVDDCTAAEEFVHTMLQQKGYRESDNREFFRATPNEVIRVVMQIPNQISNDSGFKTPNNKHTNEFNYPWLELWKTAEVYANGTDDCIQDYDKAIKLYKQAIKLGCLPAYYQIGVMYRYGFGVTENHKKAMEWYREGVEKGNYYCYSEMANIFASTQQHDNFHKCYNLLLKSKEQLDERVERFGINFGDCCYEYITTCFKEAITPEVAIAKALSKQKRFVVSQISRKIRWWNSYPTTGGKYGSLSEEGRISLALPYQSALKWAEENL